MSTRPKNLNPVYLLNIVDSAALRSQPRGLGLATTVNCQQTLGIAQKILAYIEEQAIKTTKSYCKLAVLPLNSRALAAYCKSGYQIGGYIEPDPSNHQPPTPRLIMEKLLAFSVPQKDRRETKYAVGNNFPLIKELIDHGYKGTALMRPKTAAMESPIAFTK